MPHSSFLRNHGKTARSPRRPFEKERLDNEMKLIGEFGLKNKRECWRVQLGLARIRKAARTQGRRSASRTLALPPATRVFLNCGGGFRPYKYEREKVVGSSLVFASFFCIHQLSVRTIFIHLISSAIAAHNLGWALQNGGCGQDVRYRMDIIGRVGTNRKSPSRIGFR